jgi:hypothetical protein
MHGRSGISGAAPTVLECAESEHVGGDRFRHPASSLWCDRNGDGALTRRCYWFVMKAIADWAGAAGLGCAVTLGR